MISDRSLARPRIRVLQIFSSLGVGGAETWLMALLSYFNKGKQDLPVTVQFDICLTSGHRAVFDDEALRLGCRLFYIPYGKNNLPQFARKFRRVLKQGNYNAIHDHQDYTAGWHFLLGLGYLPSVRIAHVHNPMILISAYSSTTARRFTALSGKYLLSLLATHVMGTSRQVVAEYGFDKPLFRRSSVDVANCGFDVQGFKGEYTFHHNELCKEFGWDADAKIMLFVGRLEDHADARFNQKNPTFALDVARACMSMDERVRALVVGSGDTARKVFEQRIRNWGLEDRMCLTGTRSDVPHLMLGSNLLIVPSLAEGLGMVIVEAQASGLPVLASASIPKECVVVPDLVKFLSLESGEDAWANEVLNILHIVHSRHLDYNLAVRHSPFSIENSAARLLQLYSGQ